MILDDRDKAILSILQADAATPLDRLADSAGLSRNACWRRVRLMEEAGVIRARVALLDPAAVNLGLTVFIRVRTNQHAPDWAERFRAAIAAIPEITGAYRTAGEIDYLLQARIPDVAAYDRLYRKLIERVDMVDVSASFVMEEIHATTRLPLTFI